MPHSRGCLGQRLVLADASYEADAAAAAAATKIADILRNVVGNHFRPVTINQYWLAPQTTTLARTIYDDRDFELMPVLADALEEAGCDNDDILACCRKPTLCVHGCWVLDFILGKE